MWPVWQQKEVKIWQCLLKFWLVLIVHVSGTHRDYWKQLGHVSPCMRKEEEEREKRGNLSRQNKGSLHCLHIVYV